MYYLAAPSGGYGSILERQTPGDVSGCPSTAGEITSLWWFYNNGSTQVLGQYSRFKQAQPKMCHSDKVEDGVVNQFL